MELFTLGRRFYPDSQVLIWHKVDEKLDPDLGFGTRLRLVFVEAGSGILRRAGGRRLAFLSPSLICLNETEHPILESSLDLKAQAFYFHPAVINSAFNFDNVRHPETDPSLRETDHQDVNWLRAFLQRDEAYQGLLNLDPMSARQMTQLFTCINQELKDQPDWFWPCRARSFFLEMLFLLERLRQIPEAAQPEALPDEPAGSPADPVILYLHTHYGRKITLDELARQFHTNRTTLTSQFSRSTGMPVNAYLIRLRIRLASLMLRDTSLPVCEVMERVGFSDSTHFGRTFRKYTGVSPSEYRQQTCWMLRA